MEHPARPRLAAALAAPLALLLGACTSLERPPQTQTLRGKQRVAVLTGTTLYEADVLVRGEEGPLTNVTDSAKVDLDSQLDFQLEYAYFLRDDFAIGAAAGARRYHSESVQLLGADFEGDVFWTTQWSLISRYFFPAFGAENRWRPLVGADLNYTPKVDLRSTVHHGAESTQSIAIEGDSYLALALRVGLAGLLSERIWFEVGAAYELPLDESQGSFSFEPPDADPSKVVAELEPAGLVFYIGFAYSF